MDIVSYFKNTKTDGTQKLRDFCGGSLNYDIFKIIEHWVNEPNKAIKHLKKENILSVEKLTDIFNVSRYKIYKAKKYLTDIGLLKTEHHGIPCHCVYSIDNAVEYELYSLEPDYKAKKTIVDAFDSTHNIPTEDTFVDFCLNYINTRGNEANILKSIGGIKRFENLYKDFLNKNRFINSFKGWQNYTRGTLNNILKEANEIIRQNEINSFNSFKEQEKLVEEAIKRYELGEITEEELLNIKIKPPVSKNN